MNDYVFPQDVPDASTATLVRREGGLTKRELFAAILYRRTIEVSMAPLTGKEALTAAAVTAIVLADALIEELNRENPRKG